jgi:hypothetical protein
MVNDLRLALVMKERCKSSEIVVTKKVLLEVLDLGFRSRSCAARLNILQDSPTHKFLHEIVFEGVLFIHVSREPLDGAPALAL